MKKMKVFFTAMALLAVSFAAFAQQVDVRGGVKDNAGNPIVGASVVLQGNTRVYAMSNATGTYNITVPANGTLVVSCLGYQEAIVPVNGRKVIDIVLVDDSEMLDETIVVAYGTASKASFTGSASVVKKEDIQKIAASNVTQALQGLSAGVQVINSSGQPGDGGSINIRGIGSMNASSSPLYVVDGVAYSGYINAISSSDIESMTVLKDAAATSLYGSRAANGDIVITTKKGQNENGKISFRANVGFASLAVPMPRQLTPSEFAWMNWQGLYNAALDSGNSPEEAGALAAPPNSRSTPGTPTI